MKCFILTPILCVFLLFISPAIYGQQTQPAKEDDDVVKISTELVQVDAVVVDKDGNPITNLTVGDFEVLQDGKPQSITNLSYINRQTQNTGVKKTDENTPASPIFSKAAEFGRVLTFIVDDGNCDSTQGGMFAAQKGLEKFVNEQMQPNDKVAIYQTRQGSKLIQQYTSDKTLLLNTIKKIRWVLPNINCATFGFDEQQQRAKEAQEPVMPASEIVNLNQTIGAIGVLRYVINGLRRVGGRKIVFYLSDSFPTDNGRGKVFRSYNDAQDLTALANRSSVVINTIDVRGLVIPAGGVVGDEEFRKGTDERTRIVSRESGMRLIADETGGKFYSNQNFLENPMKQALKSETGYYLLAYQPDNEMFRGKKFHKIEVKLKRPELNVRSRSGFFGVTDKELQQKPRSGDSELYEALISPLPNANVNMKLSAYFINKGDYSDIIRVLLSTLR